MVEKDRMIHTKGLAAQFVEVMTERTTIDGKIYEYSFLTSVRRLLTTLMRVAVWAGFLCVGVQAYLQGAFALELFGVCLMGKAILQVLPTSDSLYEVKEV